MRRFERARPEDAQAVLALYRRAGDAGRAAGTSGWSEDYPNVDCLREDLAREALYVLRGEDGAIAAAISMDEHDDLDEEDVGWTACKSCALMRLCVEPALQGRHLGEEMMRAISREAAAQGFQSTRHLADVRNFPALRLYRRMGYRELGRVRLYDIDFICFERLLTAADGR